MKTRQLRTWHIIGAFIIFALAALWHFVYAWIPSGVTAVIFPVNESIWEHAKLFFFPALIFFTLEYIAIGKNFRNYIFANVLSIFFMTGITFGLFYLYRDGFGIAESLIIDIILTFVGICLGLLIGHKMTVSKKKIGKSAIGIILAILLCALYGVLTFIVPKKPIFMDNNSKKYGIEAFDANHTHTGEDVHEGEDVHDDEAHSDDEDADDADHVEDDDH